MKLRSLLSTSLCALGLTASSYATSLTGQAYTAKLAWAPNNYSATFTGIVGAGMNGSGYEVLIPGYVLELDADNFGRVYSYNQGQFFGSDIFSVEVTFPDLVAEQFSVPSGVPFQYNSKFGGASLAATAKNQLTFSYWGDFTSQYGVSWYNWWGYSFETNPDYQPGGGSGGNGGGGTNSVPEATSTFALFGVAAVGLIGLRKRLGAA